MDIARARSPPALSRRPIGPRSPGKQGTLPVKNIIPLDLTARLLEDLPITPRSASPEPIASYSRSASPISAPIRLSRHPSCSSEVNECEVASTLLDSTDEVTSLNTNAEVGGMPGPVETEEKEETTPAASSSLNADSERAILNRASPFADAPLPLPETPIPATDDTDDSLSAHHPAEMPAITDALPLLVPVPPVPETEISSPLPAYSPVALDGSTVADTSVPIVPVFPTPPSEHALANNRTLPSPPLVPRQQDSPPLTPGTDTTSTEFTHVNDMGVTKGHERTLSEKSVQASIITPPRPLTPAPSTRASTPALLKAMQKRPLVGMPPPLNLEVEPIQWKGMTLDAAQWTFTSEQLQETVSKAIKQSAAESFIRVVSTEDYDTELPRELERLEASRLMTQAQYRFHMQRRGNALQSLSLCSQQPDEDDGEAMYNVTSQLAELTVACDRLMESLLRIADQKAQIQHVLDLHVASALAMALRKLNASYAKRTAELKEARARTDELQAELEEAWNMAQDMAQEMDDLDNFELMFSDDDITRDDDVPINSALEAEIYGDIDRMSGITSVHQAKVVEITGKAVATKATLTSVSGLPNAGDRSSRVSAAKKRSSRASKASLRIPKTPTLGNGERPDRMSIQSMRSRLSRSRSLRRGEQADDANGATGVPIIRLPEPHRSREASFLELAHTRPTSPAGATMGRLPPLPPKEAFVSMVQPHATPSQSEETLQYGSNPPPSPTFGTIPTISLPEQPQQQKSLPWTGRKIFTRRVQSMQPALRAADDATDPSHLARPVSDYKQFDGWPSLFSLTKAQRFSVPVLAAMQTSRGRKSSESAPAGSSTS